MCRAGQLQAVLARARGMRKEQLGFWLRHGVDEQYGGFHATLNRGGAVGAPTDKGVVQQARHAWTFAHAAASGLLRDDPAAQAGAERAARSAWRFMTDHMQRPQAPGTWRWMVSRDGRSVVDDGVNLYAQWFVIYAATQYAEAFNDGAALRLALATFNESDALFHDAVAGGYDEGSSAPQLTRERLPGGGVPRSLNAMLHGTEALAALYEASGDARVLARLTQLLGLMAGRLVTKSGVLYEHYDPADWSPVGSPSGQWGHNLESAWLVAVTSDQLRSSGRMTAQQAEGVTSKLMAVAARALREGYDAARGGVFEAGVPGAKAGQGPGASTEKVWWVQAEAMLAMWQAHVRLGGCGHLDQLERTLQFVHDHVRDPADGEWLWSVSADGGKVGAWAGSTKGNAWKASYHAGRSLMLLEQWVGRAAATAEAAAGGGQGGARRGPRL